MIVLQDSKEKIPWDFTIYPDVDEQRVVHLETADYTILGKELSICIERKKSVGEIAINLGKKSKQFLAEMDRMLAFDRRIILCEFPAYRILEFPKGSGIPHRRWRYLRMNGKYINKCLYEWTAERSIELYFANDAQQAQDMAMELLRSVYEENK